MHFVVVKMYFRLQAINMYFIVSHLAVPFVASIIM